jgi:hypothetical protein
LPERLLQAAISRAASAVVRITRAELMSALAETQR